MIERAARPAARTLACAGLLWAALGCGVATASFHRDPGRPISEARVRALERQMLGPAHAAQHAAERSAIRNDLLRWRALSPAQRRRAARLRRRQVRAASTLPPSEVGRWDAPFALPIIAINTAVLPTGSVMMWSYPFMQSGSSTKAYEARAWLWDPALGTGTDAFHEVSPPPSTGTDHAMLFCSGGSLLPDGSLLTTGGMVRWPTSDNPYWAGTKEVWTFDPWTEHWTRQPDMRMGRWYPSQVELPNGRTVIIAGNDETGQKRNTDLEVFTPSSTPDGVGTVQLFPSGQRSGEYYPHLFTMPDGHVLLAGPGVVDSALLTPPSATGDWGQADLFSWTELPRDVARLSGTAILEPAGPAGSTRVTQIGGLTPSSSSSSTVPPRDTTDTLDESAADQGWKPAAPLNIARAFHNTVVLPDSSVVAVGGGNGVNSSENRYATWPDNRGRQIEIRDPATGTWRLGPAQQEDRAYHSTAVLLPDGRVLSGGDDRVATSDTGEIYSPPYLFKGPRPSIDSAPAEIAWGAPLRIGTTSPGVTRAVLMAPGVTTHGADMQARHVELQVSSHDASGIDAIAPPSANVAPPGWYMLFVLNSDGVPSVARWVKLVAGPPPTPTPAPPAPTPPVPAQTTPAAAAFGASPLISIASRRLRLRRGSVVVRVVNGNGFDVPARATLRLPNGHLAKATPNAASLVLPPSGRATVRFAVSRASAAFGRHGKMHATLTLDVHDPAGGQRLIRRTVALRR
ncbi:MAG: hypothetical protein QOK25_2100 [Thermoleophilaceae bacterium]|nr:hypothetical protein [Thermoleophilaceae bacterium]